jgi:hypothetical protein
VIFHSYVSLPEGCVVIANLTLAKTNEVIRRCIIKTIEKNFTNLSPIGFPIQKET